ncbi:hypothetical protein C475_14518 [Halosimplex carlsbadense 2-9-1]|uniref:Uncharacterized protein n=1 Tax=Halosimplex carlsbadense 2-9-1 TaxID=797114 RepID=M0CJQ1_9EURY|nr:hypothetical protein [Halosimplex carlsbadense]ELZ23495.1 hypothetical protein C475_14518 [Halosimplex carlsbadense 2-9-1]
MVVEKLKHPLTGLAVAVSTLGQLSFGWFEPVWALASSTATYWFPAVATSGATILPELGFPNLGTNVLLAGALLYVGVQLDKLVDKIQDWKENR